MSKQEGGIGIQEMPRQQGLGKERAGPRGEQNEQRRGKDSTRARTTPNKLSFRLVEV